MGEVIAGIFMVATVILAVWLRIVRPIRGDIAWMRQGERVQRARSRRLARRAQRQHSV